MDNGYRYLNYNIFSNSFCSNALFILVFHVMIACCFPSETDMFFLAVSMVGTDFSMICQLFPHRARSEIKVST